MNEEMKKMFRASIAQTIERLAVMLQNDFSFPDLESKSAEKLLIESHLTIENARIQYLIGALKEVKE